MRNTARPLSGPQAISAWLDERAHEAWRYDFFALMRRLECLAGDAPRWGHAPRPALEAVRVAQEPSMSFAPAAVSGFEPAGELHPPRVRQTFFGHVGPNGPLPPHLCDLVRERVLTRGDRTLLEFLDSLLHRFGLQLYRAWAQARPATGMDRPGEDALRHQVGAFVGMGGAARQQRDAIHDDARLHFSGWLARRVHSAEALESVIGAYLDMPARLEHWVGHWMALPRAELCRLGQARPAARRLGGAVLGSKLWDRQHRVRLHLGPLTLAQYRQLLPGGAARRPLACWMLQLLGDEYAWDAQPLILRREVPATRLGASHAPRLGWTSWLASHAIGGDARGARLQPDPTGADHE